METIARWRTWSIATATLGVAGLAIGIFLFPARQFFASYLFAFVLWMGVPLGALSILMVHHLAGGKWSASIRRLLEAAAVCTPLGFILFLPLTFDLASIYPWARPENVEFDRILEHKAAYLNPTFFILRTALYFMVFTWFALTLRRLSLRQEKAPVDPRAFISRSAGGLVVYVLIMSFAGFDWTMSLSPHWYSTMYGFIYVVDQALTALAFILVVFLRLGKQHPIAGYVEKQGLNDLGNFLLALVVLWAYVHFMQFIIIWNGDLGEKVPWYLHRSEGGWQWVILSVVALQFSLPLAMLLMREYKQNAGMLRIVATVVLSFRAVHLFWFIVPSIYEGEFHVHVMDLFALLALGGVFCSAFFTALARAPLVATHDPALQAGEIKGYEV